LTPGLARANVTHGVREVILCKDPKGKLGLRVKSIDKGIFVQFVSNNSPAALAGLRFGDQILQVDGKNVAGYSTEKGMEVLKKANPQKIVLAVRDRPFERTITMHKDSSGHVGFTFHDNEITNIAKDTSAARNGLLIEHHILEVDGQNVVGMNTKELTKVFEQVPQVMTITIMPSFLYKHIIKCMGDSLMRKAMDRSIPEV
jgi:syntenin-1